MHRQPVLRFPARLFPRAAGEISVLATTFVRGVVVVLEEERCERAAQMSTRCSRLAYRGRHAPGPAAPCGGGRPDDATTFSRCRYDPRFSRRNQFAEGVADTHAPALTRDEIRFSGVVTGQDHLISQLIHKTS